jgi:hypothetical protein
MDCRRLIIRDKCRGHEFSLASPGDFDCVDGPVVDPDLVLQDDRLSLYCIDTELPRVLFVQTPEPLDPGASAFLYQTQHRDAESLVSVPLEVFHRLANGVVLDPTRIVFVQSTGRCGSTLVSKVFAALDGVASWSEPDIFTRLTNMRPFDGSREREVADLCESAVRLTCKPVNSRRTTHHVLKFRSQVMELAELLCQRFVGAKNVFMYRNATTWLDSVFRSLLRGTPSDDAFRQRMQDGLARCHPLVAEYARRGPPLSLACLWALDWVSSVERYLQLHDAGQIGVALRFEDLQRDSEGLIRELLAYTGLTPRDWTAVRAVLERDSQEGTRAARAEAEQAPETSAAYFEEAARIIASRPRITGPDVSLPGTITARGVGHG